MKSGTLYLFPVPLGDVDPAEVLPAPNITLLLNMRYLAVENARTARRHLRRLSRDLDLDSVTTYELNEHTFPEAIEPMLQPLAEGHDMGVMSEAGCPAVADPGSRLVQAAQRRGYRVVPLVGPSSIILSLMASGFNGQTWSFLGYLPTHKDELERRLQRMWRDIHREGATQIFIETPYRNVSIISELCRVLPGDARLCVACNLTCPDESVRTLTLNEWKTQDCTVYRKRPTIFLLYK